MLEESVFEVLNLCRKNEGNDEKTLAIKIGLPISNIEEIIDICVRKGWLTIEMEITDAGLAQLSPYKVDNAIIMAAGMSSRFAPLSYEYPKGLLKVKGEILIERQIQQLQTAGIENIVLVLGYMKEEFYYLQEKFQVDFVVNDDFDRYNNISTLMKVINQLGNSYICSSDNYFVENVFDMYVYRAYYAAVYTENETDEYCLDFDDFDRIIDVKIGGGPNVWYMLGHVYFSRDFSDRFVDILKKEYKNNPVVRTQLWEKLYMQHLDKLTLYIKKYSSDIIKEFDSLEELRQFDEEYINNTNSSILKNICRILKCSEKDIVDICASNNDKYGLAFVFTNYGTRYIYCHELNEKLENSDIVYKDLETKWGILYY